MIKRQRQEFKIVGLCVIIALLFLCAFNVTYSYFTAVASINGNMTFYNLDIKFGYIDKVDKVYTTMTGTTLTVTPKASIIARGDTFDLRFNGVDIDYLYFNVGGNSCDSYVRFMLDAYKVNEDDSLDTSVNYGQYFQINTKTSNVHTRSEVIKNSGIENVVYYMNNALTTSSNRAQFCNSITLLTNAPVEMLNCELKLTITFKAVQAANQAYQLVFNDGWGYLSSWK